MRELLPSFAKQLAQQTAFDIDDVVRAFGQVDVVQVLKDFGEPAERLTDGILGRVVLFPDEPLEFGQQTRIAQHLQMSGEDRAALIAKLSRYRVAIASDLLGDGVDCLVETLQLVVDRVAQDEPPGDAESLVVDYQGFANGYAWRNRNSLQRSHCDAGGDRGQPLRTSIMIGL